MRLKTYVWGMRLVTLVSIIALGFVIIAVDPEKSNMSGRLYFFLSLFFSLVGIFSSFLMFIRRKTIGNGQSEENIGLNSRQAILLSVMVIGILLLQSLRMLVWWDGLLVVAGIFLIELYFLSKN